MVPTWVNLKLAHHIASDSESLFSGGVFPQLDTTRRRLRLPAHRHVPWSPGRTRDSPRRNKCRGSPEVPHCIYRDADRIGLFLNTATTIHGAESMRSMVEPYPNKPAYAHKYAMSTSCQILSRFGRCVAFRPHGVDLDIEHFQPGLLMRVLRRAHSIDCPNQTAYSPCTQRSAYTARATKNGENSPNTTTTSLRRARRTK